MDFSEIKVDDEITLKFKTLALAPDVLELILHDADYLSKWLPGLGKVKTVADEEKAFAKSIEKMEAGEMLDYAIFYHGKLVGSISLFDISKDDDHGEIGYWLAQDYQGRGIIHRSLAKLLQIGFDELKLHKIKLFAVKENIPSNKVAQKVGMQLDATLTDEIKIRGKFYDMNVYYILNN